MATTMRRKNLSGVLVVVPPELKAELVRLAAENGSNLNDVAVGALAASFRVNYVGTGKRSQPALGTLRVLLRMPDPLKLRLQRKALADRTNLTHTVVAELCRMLDVQLELARPVSRSPFGGGARPSFEAAGTPREASQW